MGVVRLVRSVWMVGRVVFGRGTPLWMRLLALAAVLYGVSPLDFAPDIIPLAGWLDDATVLLAAWWLLSQRARRMASVEQNRGRVRVVEGRHRVVDDG